MKARMVPTDLKPRIVEEEDRGRVTLTFLGQSGGKGVFAEVTVAFNENPEKEAVQLSEFIGFRKGFQEYSQAALDGTVWTLKHSYSQSKSIKIEDIVISTVDSCYDSIFYASSKAVCLLLDVDTTPKLSFFKNKLIFPDH